MSETANGDVQQKQQQIENEITPIKDNQRIIEYLETNTEQNSTGQQQYHTEQTNPQAKQDLQDTLKSNKTSPEADMDAIGEDQAAVGEFNPSRPSQSHATIPALRSFSGQPNLG